MSSLFLLGCAKLKNFSGPCQHISCLIGTISADWRRIIQNQNQCMDNSQDPKHLEYLNNDIVQRLEYWTRLYIYALFDEWIKVNGMVWLLKMNSRSSWPAQGERRSDLPSCRACTPTQPVHVHSSNDNIGSNQTEQKICFLWNLR